MTNYTLTISHKKYMHLVEILNFKDPSYSNWLKEFYKKYNCTRLHRSYSVVANNGDYTIIELVFRNERDAMWFKLKWL